MQSPGAMDRLLLQLLWGAALGAAGDAALSQAPVGARPQWEQCLGWLLSQPWDNLQFWARSFTDVTSPRPEVPGAYAKFTCNCSGVSSRLSHSTWSSCPSPLPGTSLAP